MIKTKEFGLNISEISENTWLEIIERIEGPKNQMAYALFRFSYKHYLFSTSDSRFGSEWLQWKQNT
jgi:hypothetical protein